MSVRRRTSRLRFLGLRRPDLADLLGKAVNASRVGAGGARPPRSLSVVAGYRSYWATTDLASGYRRRVQQGAHPRPEGFGYGCHQIWLAQWPLAALPGRCRAGVAPIAATRPACGRRCDQRDPGLAAGDQVAEERATAGPVLGGGDLDAQGLSVALGVDAGDWGAPRASRTLSTRASAGMYAGIDVVTQTPLRLRRALWP